MYLSKTFYLAILLINKMIGPKRRPEILVNFNQLTLHSNPEAQDSSIHCGTNLKFCASESHLTYPVCILCWLLFRPGMAGWGTKNKPEHGVHPVWVNTFDSIFSASWSTCRHASTRCAQTGLKYHQLHWISVQYFWSAPDNSYLFNVQVSCCKTNRAHCYWTNHNTLYLISLTDTP
jgi:hypothetical protein